MIWTKPPGNYVPSLAIVRGVSPFKHCFFCAWNIYVQLQGCNFHIGDGHPTLNSEWVYKPPLLGWWPSPNTRNKCELRPQVSRSNRIFLENPNPGARKYNKNKNSDPTFTIEKNTSPFLMQGGFSGQKKSHPQKSPPKLAFGPQTKVFRLDFTRHIWATTKIWRNILGGKTSKHLQTSWTICWGSGVLGGSSQLVSSS